MIIGFLERGRFLLSSIDTLFSSHHGYTIDCSVFNVSINSQDVIFDSTISYSLDCEFKTILLESIDITFLYTNDIVLDCVSKNIVLQPQSFSTNRLYGNEYLAGDFLVFTPEFINSASYHLNCEVNSLVTCSFIDTTRNISLNCNTGSVLLVSNNLNLISILNLLTNSIDFNLDLSSINFSVTSRVNCYSNNFLVTSNSILFPQTISLDVETHNNVIQFMDITHGRDIDLDINNKRIISRFSIIQFLKNNTFIIDPCQ